MASWSKPEPCMPMPIMPKRRRSLGGVDCRGREMCSGSRKIVGEAASAPAAPAVRWRNWRRERSLVMVRSLKRIESRKFKGESATHRRYRKASGPWLIRCRFVYCPADGKAAASCRIPKSRAYIGNSKLEFTQVIVTGFYGVECRFGLVVFDEVMFDAGFFGMREDTFPINGALPDISEAPANFHRGAGGALVGVRGVRVLDPVFYVDEGETARIFVEINQRILASDADPAEIQFHGDKFGIGFGEEEIVREFAAE